MKNIGTKGEQLIAKWLQLQKHKILRQNWRCRWGEIDIIAQDRVDRTIVFVEVKTRSSNNWDRGGLLAIDAAKQEKIIATASLFLAKYPSLAELPCRFDVALVRYQSCIKKQQNSQPDLAAVTLLEIGQPIDLDSYRLTIKDYLRSAFE